MQVPKKRKGGFFRFIKNLFVFSVLIGVVVASFMVSYHLGKYILVPVKKSPEHKIEVQVVDPEKLAAARQRLDQIMAEELKKAEQPRVAAKKPAVKKAAAKPKSAVKKPKGNYYKVQAGLYVDKNRAANLAQQLTAKGFATYLKKVSTGWRVQAGAYKTKTQALALQNSLKSRGFKSILVYE
ncbi:SPOR domain-containing protein [Candidatus Margulisiibacteriota bacterium]